LRLPTDQERIAAVVQLCREGYDRQIMLAHDMALKMMLKTYGGYGYSHILEHIVPELRRRGVSSKQVRNMLVENPKRVFAF
jgi:phosphotriesterase-related protein